MISVKFKKAIGGYKKLVRRLLLAPIIILTVILAFGAYDFYYKDRILNNIYVAGISVGGMTVPQAQETLRTNVSAPEKISLTGQNQNFDLETKSFNFSYDYSQSAIKAFEIGHSKPLFENLADQFYLLTNRKDTPLEITYDAGSLENSISVIAGQIGIDPKDPEIKLAAGKIEVDPGEKGYDLDQQKLQKDILDSLRNNNLKVIEMDFVFSDPTLSDIGVLLAKERAEKLLKKSVVLKFEFQEFTYKGPDVIKFINPKGGFNSLEIEKTVNLVADQVDRKPQNPTFVFETGKVKEFAPSKDGVSVKKEELQQKLTQAISLLENSTDLSIAVDIPYASTKSEISTGDVNNFGIKELIGRGTSRFKGSIPSRIYNVNLAASRINGTLVKPGDTFSFNDTLGDVSKFTGYKEAYIIKDGKTILGDGGGVCQVSTTLFRAVLNAGLPIAERRAHAYRVGYYEQDSGPGLDATVYSPTTDFKFTNDTGHHILIQATADTKNASLVFELYGTKDTRVVTLSKPVISAVTPPPPDLYQDDPTLPEGVIKQVDYKAFGAKVSFSYKVEREGEVIYQKVFASNYRPWQAIFLRGTAPAQ